MRQPHVSHLSWVTLTCIFLAGDPATPHAEALNSQARNTLGTPITAQTQNTVTDYRMHYCGSYWAIVGNEGQSGGGICFPLDYGHPDLARLGIQCMPGWEFPSRTGSMYLARLEVMAGTIRNRFDTLVSNHGGILHESPNSSGLTSTEFFSAFPISESSALRSSASYSPLARGEQEYYGVYTDTLTHDFYEPEGDFVDGRRHAPIGLEVHQTSYSWSDVFARQFLIVRNWFVNVSRQVISKPTVGIYMDPDISTGVPSVGGESARGTQYDDICGYTHTVPSSVEGFDDTLDLFWSIDNDGDPPNANSWDQYSIRGAIALRVLRHPPRSKRSYNWWATSLSGETYFIDWGPRSLAEAQGYAGGVGIPRGDRGRYRMMTNGEFDYPQSEAAQNKVVLGWAQPHTLRQDAVDIADGLDSRFVVSYYDLEDLAPGDSVPLDYAIIAGRNVHQDPGNFVYNFDPNDSRRFTEGLDFSDLYEAARWAGWVYDTPGFDSDPDDGIDYRGEAYLTNCSPVGCDSVFYRGDGIPDLTTVTAPPAPHFSVTTTPHRAVLRWSGYASETAVDPLTLKRDFEGYRVYIAKTDREDAYALVGSWDRVNYKRIAYNPSRGSWTQVSDPLTVEGWQTELGEEDFDPLGYKTPSFQSAYRDTVYDTVLSANGDIVSVSPRTRYSYWAPEGANSENDFMTHQGEVHNLIQRVAVHDTIVDGVALTFGEYEVDFTNLNAAVPLYAAVTAYEFTDYESQLPPLETRPANNTQFLIPIHSSDQVIDSNLRVSVYPNPYKFSYTDHFGNQATYFSEGYEVPSLTEFREQDRRIWFINLPDTATIRIYSLDGDLIREIHHPDRFLTRYSSAVGWDLVTRNTQAVVSGIYIWRVDSRLGSQVGKLVIIK